jgi:hypothetical protein
MRVKEGFETDKMAFDWLVMATYGKNCTNYKIELYEALSGKQLWRVWYVIEGE